MQTVDLLIHSAAQLVTCAGNKPKRGQAMQAVNIISDGAIAIDGEIIVAVGKTGDLKYTARQEINASGKVICPGFVDPHTHVVFAGDRIDEFEMRIKGKTYMEIMADGGGIMNTVRATRAASLDQLIEESRARLDAMLKLGTTTAEIKTGYGLDTATELNMLRATEILDQSHSIDLIPTFLGAHAIPAEYKNDPDAYVDLVISDMLPAAANWYQQSHFAKQGTPFFIDVFCEQNAFDLDQSRRILEAGQTYGMQVKAHVDEFTSLGGVGMSIDLGAISVDHLDASTPTDIKKLAASDTIGIVIPAVNFNLGSTEFADARQIIDAGGALALTTDINPGSAPCPSMPLVMAIATRYQHLLPVEAFTASTLNAAFAIGMGHQVGSLEVGKQADVLIINTTDYRHLAYQLGGNLVEQVIKKGKLL